MELRDALTALREVAVTHPTLELLVVFGSRARGEDYHGSDWDVGYQATEGIDHLALQAHVVDALRTDAVDLADLGRSSGLLRFRAAREGVVVWSRAGAWEEFALTAALHWYDIEPVVRAAHDDLLAGLS